MDACGSYAGNTNFQYQPGQRLVSSDRPDEFQESALKFVTVVSHQIPFTLSFSALEPELLQRH
jgi:hypothetical protein